MPDTPLEIMLWIGVLGIIGATIAIAIKSSKRRK